MAPGFAIPFVPMNFRRPWLMLVAWSAFGTMSVGAPTPAPMPPSPEEIAETAAWFDSLPWPDLGGCSYVEITLGTNRVGSRTVDGPRLRGFLLGEDEGAFSVLGDGTVGSPPGGGFRQDAGWPFVVQRVPKSPPGAGTDGRTDFPGRGPAGRRRGGARGTPAAKGRAGSALVGVRSENLDPHRNLLPRAVLRPAGSRRPRGPTGGGTA